MTQCFDPKFEILPPPQIEIWEHLRPAPELGFALYGGTAVALLFGHRQSVDFDFFGADDLDKATLFGAFPFMKVVKILQDAPNTLVVSAQLPSGVVKVSFFGGIRFGRVGEPLLSRDGVVQVASIDDLMATKLKAILDRSEAKDYRDLAIMLLAGANLSRALGAFQVMYDGEPKTALMALGFFGDGNLNSLTPREKEILTNARDHVRDVPDVSPVYGSLVVAPTPCNDAKGFGIL